MSSLPAGTRGPVVPQDADRTGVLSAPFVALPAPARQQAIDALLELPQNIGLLRLRDLGPSIGRLRRRHHLNILATEALAAAVELKADVYLSAPSPRLEAALQAEARNVTVLRSQIRHDDGAR